MRTTAPPRLGRRGDARRAAVPPAELGFSLMEVIVATVIATVAVLGLAYTFGVGRGYIDRYEVARSALAAAEGQIETLAARPTSDPDLAYGAHTTDFAVDGERVGTTIWTVSAFDDPADELAPTDPRPADLRRVVVEVTWSIAGLADTVRVERLFPAF